jgi:hypothetical protein
MKIMFVADSMSAWVKVVGGSVVARSTLGTPFSFRMAVSQARPPLQLPGPRTHHTLGAADAETHSVPSRGGDDVEET